MDVHVEITKSFCNAYCTQKSFLLRKISRVGIPKSTFLVIIFRVFMWPLSLRNAGPRRIIHLQCSKIASKKRQDHLIKAWWTMELIFCLLIMKWHPRKRKFAIPGKKNKWKFIDLFQPKTSTFSTRALIWVHFKTVRYFFLNQFLVFFHNKKMHNTI